MGTTPADTSAAIWHLRREILARMDPDERDRVAIDLSEAVREIQIQGLLARYAAWERAHAVSFGFEVALTTVEDLIIVNSGNGLRPSACTPPGSGQKNPR
jgi:hypothetical protein